MLAYFEKVYNKEFGKESQKSNSHIVILLLERDKFLEGS